MSTCRQPPRVGLVRVLGKMTQVEEVSGEAWRQALEFQFDAHSLCGSGMASVMTCNVMRVSS